MNQMMKQVQKMQQDMARAQAELKELTLEASAGGGVVKATANGHKEIVSIKINPEVVDPDDVEMLEDLILIAVNDVLAQVDELSTEKLGKYTSGLNIPGLF
jgi:DNA-binding YbaB/EbfC family protein